MFNNIFNSNRKQFTEPEDPGTVEGMQTYPPSKSKADLQEESSVLNHDDTAESTHSRYQETMTTMNNDESSTISKGCLIEGNITVSGCLKIEGKITGDITCDKDIIIGESAEVDGNITTVNLQIAGLFKGNASISGECLIASTGVVYGDLRVDTLNVNGGANVNGSISMRSDEEETESDKEETEKKQIKILKAM